MLRLPFDNQKVKENYAIFLQKVLKFFENTTTFFENIKVFLQHSA